MQSKHVYSFLGFFFVLTIGLTAQPYWPECSESWGCNSADVTLHSVYLGDINKVPLQDCNLGETVTAYVWVDFENANMGNRWTGYLRTDVYFDDVYERLIDTCLLHHFTPGLRDTLLGGVLQWSCGVEVTLKNALVAATQTNPGVGVTCATMDTCGFSGAKCNRIDSIRVAAPLIANFTWACTTPANTIAFMDATSGGTPPFMFSWDFGDGMGTSSMSNPNYTYVAPGPFNVQLIVTDSEMKSDTMIQMVDLSGCCNLNVTCPATADPGMYDCNNPIPPPVTTLTAYEMRFGDVIGDNPCGNIVISSSDDPEVTDICSTTLICRTYVILDDLNGNMTWDQGEDSVHCVRKFTFIPDMIGPALTLPADGTVLCSEDTSVTALGMATGIDDCGGMVTVSWVNNIAMGSCPQEYTVERIWTGTDQCGQTTSESQFIEVVDTVPPMITMMAMDITVECGMGQQNQLDNWLMTNGGAIASDACGGMVTWTNNFGSSPNACEAGNSIPVTFYAMDPCGNVDSTTADLTIDDSTPPMITQQASNMTVECDGTGNIIQYTSWINNNGGAMASDDCGAVSWSSQLVLSTPGCGNTQTDSVMFIVADACGNRDTTRANFIIDDMQPPTPPTAPMATTVSCATDIPTAEMLIATDVCQGQVAGVASDVVSDSTCKNQFTVTRTWTFTDGCNNASMVQQIITVLDNVYPTILLNYSGGTVTQDTTINLSCEEPMPVFSVVGSDNCSDFRIVVSSSISMGSCPILQTIQQTYSVIDSCSNQANIMLTIVVRDTTAPAINVPPDQTVECSDDLSPSALGMATANDNCLSTAVSSMDMIQPGPCPHSYSILRIWTAMDSCNNMSQDTQLITVEDTSPPIVTAAEDVTIECGSSFDLDLQMYIDTMGGASATDNCSADVVWTHRIGALPNSCDPSGNATFPISFIATDSCGNQDSTVAMISVQDNTPPEITVEASNMTVECDGAGNISDYDNWIMTNGGAMAMDDCGSAGLTWTNEVIASTDLCGATRKDSIRFIVTDLCGNRDSTNACFIIEDTQPPSITLLPADTLVECSLTPDPSAVGTATASDLCSGTNVTLTSRDSIVPGSCPQDYVIFKIWTAQDECMNAAQAMQRIEVRDTTPPVMTCPPMAFAICSSAEVPITGSYLAFLMAGGSAFDVCGGLDTGSFAYVGETGIPVPAGVEVSRTYEISDSCENRTTCVQIILVQDNEPPMVSCRDTVFLEAASNGIAMIPVDSVLLDSSDNCGIASLVLSQAEIDCDFNYNIDITRSVTLTAIDFAGNRSSCTSVLIISCPCPDFRLQPTCQSSVTLGLDENCEIEITPDLILNGDVLECYNPYDVNASDALGRSYGNLLGMSAVGQTFTVTILDTITGNSCWSTVTIEDKFAANLTCEDQILNCWDAEEFLAATPEEDNCGYGLQFEELHRTWTDFECDHPEYIGYVERSVVSTDVWGNSNRCDDQRIYIIRENLADLVCPDDPVEIECCSTHIVDGSPVYVLWDLDYVYEDEDGYSHPIPFRGGLVEPPYISTNQGPHYIGSSQNSEGGVNNGKCNIIAEYKDHVLPTCGSTYKIRREWKIFDWCTGEDTMCIQWIKILDTIGPEVDGEYGKPICLDGEARCNSPVIGYDITAYDECRLPRTFAVKPHECVAHVDIAYPPIINECGLKAVKGDEGKIAEALSKLKVVYTIRYEDPTHPGKEIVLHDEIGPEGDVVYLPGGWYQVIYYITDGCWNETYACEYIAVEDNVAPTPVCDEITQVTVDPDSCWVRVYARDLDDGSNDNCAQNLHFAVAHMDTIEYYREHWNRTLLDCYGEYDYYHYKYYIDELIEDWINCYVFNDYVDLYECGRDMLVLRVYEADGLPVYDEHTFVGSGHQWFCFNLYDDYACFFKYHYEEFAHYQNPQADLCDYEFGNGLVELKAEDCGGRFFPAYHKLLYNPYCQCFGVSQDEVENLNCNECEGISVVVIGQPGLNVAEIRIGLRGGGFLHGPTANRACCVYESESATSDQAEKWWYLVDKYPELAHLDCKRNQFAHLHSDCMIEVIKDDKTPPVCKAPPVVSYYCDGVPVVGSFFPNGGNDEYCWKRARFAHDICLDSDFWQSPCRWDDPTDGGTGAQCAYGTGPWCVDAPWDGGDHGYYGGPSNVEYHYDDPDCDADLFAWYPESNGRDWKPIYCRFWLMLDKYDTRGEGKPDPLSYFGEPEYYDNCWEPEITEETVGDVDECGVGYFTRTWTVTDKCGNTSTCAQTITLKARSDFEVKFPADVEVYCDELQDLSPFEDDPDSYPVVTDDDCELIGISYNDQIIDTEQDGCFKILRTWKVIDWCVYSPDIHSRYPDVIVDDRCVADEDNRPCVIRNLKDDGDGFMIYLQVLKVVDDVAPEVRCNPDSLFCIYDEECDELYVEYDLGSATDNCTEALQYRYAVNPNGDSSEEDWIYGHGYILQNTLPVGEHTVRLYARDDCGNEGYCELAIEIRDCKPPTPYCYDGIATVVMPSTDEIAVWARDLDAGSFDNCTDPDLLRFTFSSIPPEEDSTYVAEDRSSYHTFSCDDLGEQTVTIYVWDETGNVDFCAVTLLIQAGSEACISNQIVTTTNESNMDKDLMNEVKKEEESTIQGLQLEDSNPLNHLTPLLYQNRPNPFTAETLIGFELPRTENTLIQIMDVTGRVVKQYQGTYHSGYHEIKVRDLQGKGMYYYQLKTSDATITKKMIMIE